MFALRSQATAAEEPVRTMKPEGTAFYGSWYALFEGSLSLQHLAGDPWG